MATNEVIERRCRRSPTGIEDCVGSATGGTGGATGATGTTGAPGGDLPDIEAFASTEEDETVVVVSLPMNDLEVLTIGVRWLGFDASQNILIHESTFVFKRAGGGPLEIGVHDNGDIRDVIQIVGAQTDYGANVNNIEITVTGVVATPIDWIVQVWFSTFVIG